MFKELACSKAVTKPEAVDLKKWEDSDECRQKLWHSSAHVLGCAIEHVFPDSLLGTGPVKEKGGFYYDFKTEEEVNDEKLKQIQKRVNHLIKQRLEFEQLTLEKEKALEMFSDNKFKQELIERHVEKEASLYRLGEMVDLCKGPHLPNSGQIGAISILNSSGSYWNGDANGECLTRIHGMAFPKSKQMRVWQAEQKKRKERDHRLIGAKQRLFSFSDCSPGNPFFHPKGTAIYNSLIEYLRREYLTRGYKEVITPDVFKTELWEQSGHL